MKTDFTVSKKEVTVDTELRATGIYINLQVNFERKIIHDKGKETEVVFAQDYISETAYHNSENENISDALKADIQKLIDQCVKQAKEKYK